MTGVKHKFCHNFVEKIVYSPGGGGGGGGIGTKKVVYITVVNVIQLKENEE